MMNLPLSGLLVVSLEQAVAAMPDFLPPRAEVLDDLIIDPGNLENAIFAYAIDGKADVSKLVRQCGVICRPGGHFPIANDFGMQTADRIIARSGREIENDAVGVQIWITEDPTIGVFYRPALAMLKRCSCQRDVLEMGAIPPTACPGCFTLQHLERGADCSLLGGHNQILCIV